MIIYLCILIPFITALVLLLLFKHKTTWWELSIPLVSSLIFIIIFKILALNYQTKDIEYINDIIIEARYYEEWNEWITETCYEDCNCTTDEDGYESCDQCAYDCSYMKTHNEYWNILTITGWSLNISQNEYNRIVNKYQQTPIFVDMRRDYYRKDGDMYKVIWNGSDETLECVVRSQTYFNKTQISEGIYKFSDVTKEEVKQYRLYNYPKIDKNHKQRHILGSMNKEAEHNLEIINGRLGDKQQLKTFIFLFDEPQTVEAGYKQRDFLDGGNKNEFIITIGINSKNKPIWCLPFTWSDNPKHEIQIRNYIMKQEKLDLVELTKFMYPVLRDFERKQFKDFDYLQVYPTNKQIMWCLILTLLINLIISIWIILNKH